MARGTPLWPTLRVAQSAACSVARYWTHPMAWYGIMPFASYLKRALSPDGLRADSFGINTLLVEPELARLGIDG
jgi:hypothetical protein